MKSFITLGTGHRGGIHTNSFYEKIRVKLWQGALTLIVTIIVRMTVAITHPTLKVMIRSS